MNTKHNAYSIPEDYHTNLLAVSFKIRIIDILLGLTAAALIKKIVGVPVPQELFFTFYAWFLTSLGYLIFFSRKFLKNRQIIDKVHFSYYFFGIVYAVFIAHYLGGAEWIAFFIYFFDLVYANVLLPRSKGAFISLFMALSYFLLVLLEYKGIVPHRGIFSPDMMTYDNLRYFVSTNLAVIAVVFFLMSYSTGFFSKIKQDRENHLMDSKNRFAAKSEQLGKIAEALKKQIAENAYLKEATMEYIEKKESELVAVKKDLEGQIDKLRQTQKTMVFMIDDLNKMSSQLKSARDHLEEEVKKRTDKLMDISQKLHRSERLSFLGRLAGSVTHELRNPLAILKNSTYYLKKKIRDSENESIVKNIEIIDKEVARIDAIIENIMGFARTTSPNFKRADIRTVVEHAVSLLNVPESIKIEKEYNEVPEVEIDANQVTHALTNIANNAIIAMNANGVLIFRVLEKDDFVCIEIEDTGPGIPSSDKELIFEPLYSSRPKGTGLGLPIAKMMVEKQEGRIDFESSLGKGTIFKIFLPIKRKVRGGANG